jgi:4-hydroxythreonine-4-phosphate dehydrogenase
MVAYKRNQKPYTFARISAPFAKKAYLTQSGIKRLDNCLVPLVIGGAKIFETVKQLAGCGHLLIHVVNSVSDAIFEHGTVDVLHLDLIDMQVFSYGKVSAMCGNATFQCVKKVIELAHSGEVDATCTSALNKEAMNLALQKEQLHFDGHTEIFATYTHTSKYAMMLAHHDLRVMHVSTHCSLREACDRVKKERVLDVIQIADRALKEMGILNPRVAVAGLNPHAGENGLLGSEELEEILPTINQARLEGILAEGPFPADSLFSKALGGWYDVVIAMYHDQGHIPLKTVGFVYDREKNAWKAVEGVNITLGLPIIRTSVDHGTGFDQAGKGTSSELSLLNALDYAIRMAQNKR